MGGRAGESATAIAARARRARHGCQHGRAGKRGRDGGARGRGRPRLQATEGGPLRVGERAQKR
jgi:hypothetical protein